MRAFVALAALTLIGASAAHASAPRLIQLVPPAGALAADTSLRALELHFDVPMNGGVTVLTEDMPELTGSPAWDSTRRVLRIPVRLASAHAYRLQINAPHDRGFASATGEPLEPFLWEFRTAGDALPDDFTDPALSARLAAAPTERTLARGRLRMSHLYVTQARIVAAARGPRDTAAIARMVREVWAPHREFWAGYVGDEAAFRERVAVPLLGESHPIRRRIAAVLALKLDSLFTATERWVSRTTGLEPRGHWVLVFGPGTTDMGGIGDMAMLVDFTRQSVEPQDVAAILPHELVHMLRGLERPDPDAGTVLSRAIGEGVAVYAVYVHGRGTRSEARALGYSDDEWRLALANERALAAALATIASSRRREDSDRVASRSERLVAAGPPAAGYFVGFRIVQAYVARYGASSWTQILRLPVRDVLRRSGYALRANG